MVVIVAAVAVAVIVEEYSSFFSEEFYKCNSCMDSKYKI
jgi:hypothetical protein